MKPKPAKKPIVRPVPTKEQKRAAQFLELHGIVHFLMTEQRCPVIFEGSLGYVSCPGVSKEAFKLAIDKRVAMNLCHWLDAQPKANKIGLKARGKRV